MQSIRDLKVNLESKILSSKKVVLVPHTPVDFDAFASVIGLSLVVSKLEKDFSIIIDDQAYKMEHSVKKVIDDARKKFNIINKETYLKTYDPNDLFVFADVNKKDLVCLKEELNNIDKNNIIIIDHHDEGSTTIDTEYKYINPNSSSASEIIIKLLNNFKIKYSTEIANYLLAGIYLDTNKLSKNISPDTFKMIANLMKNGASNSVIDEWFLEDFESDKRVLELISKSIINKYSFAISMAEEESEYTKEEIAKVADHLLKYGVDAAFSIGKIDNNIVSVSARSKDKVNVGEIMKELDGGGNSHSGATKLENVKIEEVGKRLVKLLEPPYIKK